MIPLSRRPDLMCDYTGQKDDPLRHSPNDLPEDIIDDCSIEDAKATTFAEFKEELKNKGYINPSDEDVLSYALFPQVAEEFFQKHYKPITAYVKE